jgi:hypothetical protein
MMVKGKITCLTQCSGTQNPHRPQNTGPVDFMIVNGLHNSYVAAFFILNQQQDHFDDCGRVLKLTLAQEHCALAAEHCKAPHQGRTTPSGLYFIIMHGAGMAIFDLGRSQNVTFDIASKGA